MSRRSRHGRRPQPSTTQAEPSDSAGERLPAAPVDAEPAAAPVMQAAASAAVSTASWSPSEVAAGETGPADVSDGEAPRITCTQAQLRRFIKSRPWIPMHELRRRFGIMGGDDDVTPVRVGNGTVFVGLPGPEGRMLGELLNAGDVGFELSLDPGAPIVVGVYPMRPVPRG